MQLTTLMKVIQTTGRIQELKPDNEELSLLAAIGMLQMFKKFNLYDLLSLLGSFYGFQNNQLEIINQSYSLYCYSL